jgi:hypothetical protein
MTATGTDDAWLGGALRLTWVTDPLPLSSRTS